MLFETTLVVLMTGLMTHVGDDSAAGPDFKTHVVLVEDRHHPEYRPVIYVEERFVRDSGAITHELDAGDEIRFTSGVSAGRAEATEKFHQFVPSLTEPITNALLHDDVKKKIQHQNVVASMTYPEGKLFPVFHSTQAKFYRGDDLVRTQWVPRLTAFEGPTTGDVEMEIKHRNGKPTKYQLKPNAVVSIVNQPHMSEVDDAEGSEHFSNYTGVLKRRYLVVPRRIASVREGTACTEQPQLRRSDVRVGDLATEFFLVSARSAAATPSASMSDPVAKSKAVIDILISDHPACTNTDWP